MGVLFSYKEELYMEINRVPPSSPEFQPPPPLPEQAIVQGILTAIQKDLAKIQNTTGKKQSAAIAQLKSDMENLETQGKWIGSLGGGAGGGLLKDLVEATNAIEGGSNQISQAQEVATVLSQFVQNG
jgi:hypothetical protein